MKKIRDLLFRRVTIVGFLIVVQLVILMVAILRFSNYLTYFYSFCAVLSIFVVLWIVDGSDNPGYKLAWTIPILLFPVFGGLFYLFFGLNKDSKHLNRKLQAQRVKTAPLLSQEQAIRSEIEQSDPSVAAQMEYIRTAAGFPVYKNTETKYFKMGEDFFKSLKEELQKAERYIFLEYFIIMEGKVWNEILDILVEKVKAGVEVRVIYDDMGCVKLLPYRYNEYLQSLGIQCAVFNPFLPVASIWHNNRDHRKIAVIDGHTAFTGGINLSDEYVNITHPHGHWKDTAICLSGDGAWSFAVMFLSLWNTMCNIEEDYNKYRPLPEKLAAFQPDGWVMPYGDEPTDNETVGENVYLNLVSRAQRNIYICTPYFIVDNETVTALCLAAKSGVDVRIITPHIADKWYVHTVTRAYYPQLIENGVKVYEYTPGFIHAKTVISDEKIGIVGTINFDYRSLYLHFECAAMLYKSSAISALYDDFEKTLEVSQEVTLQQCRSVPFYVRLVRSVMRLFAPLM